MRPAHDADMAAPRHQSLLRRIVTAAIFIACVLVALVWFLHQTGQWEKTVEVVRVFFGGEAAQKTDEVGEKINETGERAVDDPQSVIERILAGKPPIDFPDFTTHDEQPPDDDAPYLPPTLPNTRPGDDTQIDWQKVQKQLDGLGTTTIAAGQRIEPYDRARHFGEWIDHNGDGCREDEEVRFRDSVEVTLRPGSSCAPQTGILHDPYSGKIIPYDRAVSPLAVEVEHIVSLRDVYDSGGWAMSFDERVTIAHDLSRELVLASRAENQAKKDKTPADWMPSDPAAWCWYASAYIDVKATYKLTIDDENRTFLGDVVAVCSR